ncbi:hypothetical protein PV797_09780 [Clostridiaceae bacterium M8S5]|nr:hypothetical protein PV797_09780 [Clostridiaceae bacterium M8S5]
MGYHLELSKYSLDYFKDMLINRNLIPSMMILRDDIDRRFKKLSGMGTNTMKELYDLLKTKKKAEVFAEKSGIDREYIIVLRRAVGSFITPPRKLSDYPFVDENLQKRLALLNLKTSIDLYRYFTNTPIEKASKELELDTERLIYLKKLIDVTRLRYVSPIIATTLVEGGYDSVKKIANIDKTTLYESFINTNKILKLYRGNIGRNDILFLIEDAKLFVSMDEGKIYSFK